MEAKDQRRKFLETFEEKFLDLRKERIVIQRSEGRRETWEEEEGRRGVEGSEVVDWLEDGGGGRRMGSEEEEEVEEEEEEERLRDLLLRFLFFFLLPLSDVGDI
eukprot:TRINITY_DN2678_c0_g1_i1.p3 TRINITY_DN2678_c0_g1~~TRINITY_DN2678_c0_g1_i1.p3  ORF type:complete len:104 (-),score=53.87 TRINITY_DN2678_c0_g1_i1:67-378(-)